MLTNLLVTGMEWLILKFELRNDGFQLTDELQLDEVKSKLCPLH
jgi:hypothetical protein